MRLLLLRGSVCKDRPWTEIEHKTIEEEDCIYIQMAYHLTEGDYGEVWLQGKPTRSVCYRPGFHVRWMKKIKHGHFLGGKPDVIIARGGFPMYDDVLKKFPKALKVRYGAGQRFLPSGFTDYQLLLVDATTQLITAKRMFPKIPVEFILKPAPDNLIYPVDVPKKYDVCYIANATQEKIKGIKWVYKTFPKDMTMLHLGFKPKRNHPGIRQKRVLRHEIAKQISQCRVGIIPYDTIDSMPRAMVEMMACGLPVVTFESVRYWKERYPAYPVPISHFWETVRSLTQDQDYEENRQKYVDTLSMPKAIEHLQKVIEDARAYQRTA